MSRPFSHSHLASPNVQTLGLSGPSQESLHEETVHSQSMLKESERQSQKSPQMSSPESDPYLKTSPSASKCESPFSVIIPSAPTSPSRLIDESVSPPASGLIAESSALPSASGLIDEANSSSYAIVGTTLLDETSLEGFLTPKSILSSYTQASSRHRHMADQGLWSLSSMKPSATPNDSSRSFGEVDLTTPSVTSVPRHSDSLSRNRGLGSVPNAMPSAKSRSFGNVDTLDSFRRHQLPLSGKQSASSSTQSATSVSVSHSFGVANRTTPAANSPQIPSSLNRLSGMSSSRRAPTTTNSLPSLSFGGGDYSPLAGNSTHRQVLRGTSTNSAARPPQQRRPGRVVIESYSSLARRKPTDERLVALLPLLVEQERVRDLCAKASKALEKRSGQMERAGVEDRCPVMRPFGR